MNNEIQYDIEIANRILEENDDKSVEKIHISKDSPSFKKAINLLLNKKLVVEDCNGSYKNTSFASEMLRHSIKLTMSDFRAVDENSGIANFKRIVADLIMKNEKLENENAITGVCNNAIKIVAKELFDLGILRADGGFTEYGLQVKHSGKKFLTTDFTNEVCYIDEIDKQIFEKIF